MKKPQDTKSTVLATYIPTLGREITLKRQTEQKRRGIKKTPIGVFLIDNIHYISSVR
jgi:hypothetical protein